MNDEEAQPGGPRAAVRFGRQIPAGRESASPAPSDSGRAIGVSSAVRFPPGRNEPSAAPSGPGKFPPNRNLSAHSARKRVNGAPVRDVARQRSSTGGI